MSVHTSQVWVKETYDEDVVQIDLLAPRIGKRGSLRRLVEYDQKRPFLGKIVANQNQLHVFRSHLEDLRGQDLFFKRSRDLVSENEELRHSVLVPEISSISLSHNVMYPSSVQRVCHGLVVMLGIHALPIP